MKGLQNPLIKAKMSQKMTLQQYIESRNYKRRLSSKSKSRNKHQQRSSSPPLTNSINSSLITGSFQSKDQVKPQQSQQMSDLVNEIKQIDQELQGFSLIHKRVQEIKEFVRQCIRDDKVFVTFCKKLQDLQNVYRLQLIQAYRFQLFKYQFDNENKIDDEKRKMIRLLNDHYMDSKFQYKKSIMKEKIQLTKSQKIILQQLIQENAKSGATGSKLVESQFTAKQPAIQKQPSSFMQNLVMFGSSQGQSPQIKNAKMFESNFISTTEYATVSTKPQTVSGINLSSEINMGNKQKPIQQKFPNKQTNLFKDRITSINTNIRHPQTVNQLTKQYDKDNIENQGKNTNYTRSPSAKKVIFLQYDSGQQNTNQHPIPDFENKKQNPKNNPEKLIKDIDQFDVNVASVIQSSSSGSQLQGNFLAFLNKNSSKDEKPIRNQKPQRLQANKNKQYQTQPVKKVQSPRQNTQRKKSAKQIIEQRQRQKLLQSKDYLRVKR